ncbi:MAG: prolipoprotein diacylglyceryl transferase [Alphaproteobacteria bacterium]|nr:prolipoprotein diacylglyceryl transferase [Alphaproteobacteria bacterium]
MAIVVNPISPVAFSVFGIDVRWYALAYIVSFILVFWLFAKLAKDPDSGLKLSKKQYDDYMTWVILGVVLGGRLGYVLFYNLPFFIAHPLEIFALWHGGMSFHGGLTGVILATLLFAYREKVSFLRMLDLAAVVAPMGLFFGRIANFINMEVMGRETNMPWGVVFNGQNEIAPRHPSPLYEAFGEGIVLFTIMLLLYKYSGLKKHPGAIAGIMGMLYAIIRVVCEFFRAPDAQIGFLTSWGLTMGQLLSGVLFMVGLAIFIYSIFLYNQNKHKSHF